MADAPGTTPLLCHHAPSSGKFRPALDGRPADLDQFAPDDDTRSFIRERLSATRDEVYVAEDARLDSEPADALDGVQFELDDGQ